MFAAQIGGPQCVVKALQQRRRAVSGLTDAWSVPPSGGNVLSQSRLVANSDTRDRGRVVGGGRRRSGARMSRYSLGLVVGWYHSCIVCTRSVVGQWIGGVFLEARSFRWVGGSRLKVQLVVEEVEPDGT